MIQKRADSVQGFTQQSIKDEISNLTRNSADVAETENDLQKIQKQTEGHEEQIKVIRKDIDILKAKIAEAREKASKVKIIYHALFQLINVFNYKVRIAVRSDAGSNCSRTYLSPIMPSSANTIVLKFRPAMVIFSRISHKETY